MAKTRKSDVSGQLVRVWRSTHEQAKSLCQPLSENINRPWTVSIAWVYDAGIKVLAAKLNAEREQAYPSPEEIAQAILNAPIKKRTTSENSV